MFRITHKNFQNKFKNFKLNYFQPQAAAPTLKYNSQYYGVSGYLENKFPVNSKYGYATILSGGNQFFGPFMKSEIFHQKFEIDSLVNCATNVWSIGRSDFTALLSSSDL